MKSYRRKLNFELGTNPKIEKKIHGEKHIPKPYHSVLLLSADYALARDFSFSKTPKVPLEKALKKVRNDREKAHSMVELCDLEECKSFASEPKTELKSFIFSKHTIENFVNSLGYRVQRPDKIKDEIWSTTMS